MPPTPWKVGRLDGRNGASQLLFGRTYEDAEIERAAFPSSGRIFCIAASGDTAFALCTTHPVTAVDINPAQVAYAKARVAGSGRIEGVAERWMRRGRAVTPLLGWGGAAIEEFLGMTDLGVQREFWKQHLETRRLKGSLACLLSATTLRWVYSRELLKALPERFDRVLLGRLERLWSTHPNATNPFARLLLTGEAPEPPIPREAPSIQFIVADAASYLESCEPGSFSGFSLSNILDGGVPDDYRRRLWRAVRRAGTDDAVVVRRSFSEPEATMSGNIAGNDRSGLWGVVSVGKAREVSA